MPLSFTERRKILKKANYLELHPVRLHNEEIDNDSLVTVLIPKFKNPFLVKYLVPKMKSPDIKLKLDELGSAAWILMDGKRNVAAVASLLTEKFGEKIQPVNERLTKFLTGLYEQRLITFQEINK
ncbi:MAG: PqqD family protein [Ignavibacteriales bacterium]|nr:PqqD family protein [Ignavibacteriales bacterium]